MFTLNDWISERNALRTEPSITPAMTQTVASETPSVDVMLMAVDRLAQAPVLIGTLHGCNVYADRSVAEGVVKVVDPLNGHEMLRFSVNHQYIKGTKIQEAARAALRLDN